MKLTTTISALLLAYWFISGILLASIIPPWAGEDELGHFGYAYNLYQSHRLWLGTDLIQSDPQVLAEFARYYPQDLDPNRPHVISTHYQPPAYYLLLAQLARWLPQLSILQLLYFWRYSNVVLTTIWATLILKFVARQSAQQASFLPWLFISLLWFNPQLRLLNSQINSANWDILLTTIVVLLSYRLAKQPTLAIVGTTTIVLLTSWLSRQTTAFILPAVWLGLWQGACKVKLKRRQVALYLWMTLLPAIIAWPILQHLSQQVQLLPDSTTPLSLTWSRYLIQQLPRIRYDWLIGYWQEQVAMIPLWLPRFWLKFWQTVSGLGLFALLWRYRNRPAGWLRHDWIITLPSLTLMVGFLLIWDYLNLNTANQYWFKGRYLFSYILPITQVVVSGWQWFVSTNRWVVLRTPIWLIWGSLTFISAVIELSLHWYL